LKNQISANKIEQVNEFGAQQKIKIKTNTRKFVMVGYISTGDLIHIYLGPNMRWHAILLLRIKKNESHLS
jgi:hypothetical protein